MMEIAGITQIDNRKQEDHSIILVTEVVDNDSFAELVLDKSVHIIF